MPHMVEKMFSVREAPWHGLGAVLDAPPTVEEGLKAAGLDWAVSTRRLYTADGLIAPAYAVVRDSDESVLGVVGRGYTPLQNVDAFAWFQPFLDAGQASLETAGSLARGSRVWVLARLNRAPLEVAPGDEVVKYLLLSNSHDGSLAVRVGFVPTRVVCWNTLSLAHRDERGQLLRLKHSSRVVANLESVREAVNAIDGRFEATAELYRRLVTRDISQADLRKYVSRVLGAPEQPGPRLRNILGRVTGLFEAGAGNGMPSVRGTYWAAYNAVSEWLAHERGRTADSRVNSLWYGDSAQLNARALNVALDMAG